MSDTTPIHNLNIVMLTEKLQDAVSGADNGIKAATDGTRFTSLYRERAMSDAYGWCVEEVIRKMPTRAEKLISGAIATGSLSQVTAGIAIKKDYIENLRLARATPTKGEPRYQYFEPSRKPEADTDNIPDLKRCYTIYGGTLYSYTRTNGVLTADNSITLSHYYFKKERIDSSTGALVAANTAPDITLDRRWYPACIAMAAFFCLDRLGDADSKALAQSYLAEANQLFTAQLGS